MDNEIKQAIKQAIIDVLTAHKGPEDQEACRTVVLNAALIATAHSGVLCTTPELHALVDEIFFGAN